MSSGQRESFEAQAHTRFRGDPYHPWHDLPSRQSKLSFRERAGGVAQGGVRKEEPKIWVAKEGKTPMGLACDGDGMPDPERETTP